MIYVVVLGAIVAGLGIAIWMAREAQHEQDLLHEAEDEAAAAARIAEAEANAPRTRDELVDRLRDPGRGL